MKDLREKLAAVQHEIWSHWMKYMFKQGYYHNIMLGGCIQNVWVMPMIERQRWERQMNTLYKDLPEGEKESDRHQADKILKLLASPKQ
jgi:hypothetical protein